MTLLILKGDVPYGYVPNVPDGKTRDEVMVLYLIYMGVDATTHHEFRSYWIASCDYEIMNRWHREMVREQQREDANNGS